MMSEYLSPKEFAQEFGISAQLVRKLLNSGAIRGTQFGAIWRIPRSEVERYAQQAKGV
jgi:excisionase family DNA binding protein